MHSQFENRAVMLLGERAAKYRDVVNPDDLAAAREARIQFCAVLEHLLGAHLRSHPDWEPDAWVDGVLPGAVDVQGLNVITVAGLVVWNGDDGCFLDPFFARVELTSSGDFVMKYTLYFADAWHGIRKFPYTLHSKHRFDSLPTSWIFEFENL